MLNVISGTLSAGYTAPVETNSYWSIATANGTGISGAITFSSIPSTYKHLQLRIFARDVLNAAPGLNLTLNSDTGANYSRHRLTGNGSTTGAVGEANISNIPMLGQAGVPSAALTYGVLIVDILEYANTNIYKTLRVLSGQDSNGSGGVDFTSGSWRNTSAVSTVTVNLNSGTFSTGTQIALYGIKG